MDKLEKFKEFIKDKPFLIEKVEKFLSLTFEQKREMGMRGREKVEREFDRNIVVDRYMKIVDDLEQNSPSEFKGE